MMVNGKEISQWVDLVSFDNNQPYLKTGLVDALLTEDGNDDVYCFKIHTDSCGRDRKDNEGTAVQRC